MSTEANRRITLHAVAWPSFIQNPPSKNLGVWKTKSGGGTEAEAIRDKPGGMEAEEIYAAAPSAEDVEVTRTFKLDRDIPLRSALRNSVGFLEIEVHDQHLDRHRNPQGSPEISKGLLVKYDPPPADANSDDVAEVGLTVAIPAGGIA